MYKKICMGLLLSAGSVFGMDDVIGMGGYAAVPFGAAGFATPPRTPDRRVTTPGAPVKTPYADCVEYAVVLNQIFLRTPTVRHAEQVCACAQDCLRMRQGTDNDAAELRQMISVANAYLGRATSPSIYGPSRVSTALFQGPNDEYDSDESM